MKKINSQTADMRAPLDPYFKYMTWCPTKTKNGFTLIALPGERITCNCNHHVGYASKAIYNHEPRSPGSIMRAWKGKPGSWAKYGQHYQCPFCAEHYLKISTIGPALHITICIDGVWR